MDWYCEKLHCWMSKSACAKRRDIAKTQNGIFKDAGCDTCGQIETRKAMNEKVCIKCGISKPFSEFHKNSECKHGLDSRCKACKSKKYKKAKMDTQENTQEIEKHEAVEPVQDRGPKEINGKPNWAVFPFTEAEYVVKVFEHGVSKYGAPFTYRKGIPKDELWSAIMRHLIAIQNGDEIDNESGCPHMAHIAANAMMALSQK